MAFSRSLCLFLLIAGTGSHLHAQPLRSVVVDQTGLPLPGVTVQLLDGDRIVASTATDGEGTFQFDPQLTGDTIAAALDGFQPARVGRDKSARIELQLARATETTTVVASTVESAAPTSALLGSTLTADTVARMPSAHMQARESLPLLPSVMRGADGLMQLGGAKAYETPLTLDGFNVTDPATGLSSINLPLENVAGIEALRDPMSVTYGRSLGGLVRLESKPGGDKFKTGVQGFVPRPRFARPGFGRLEGIFPRAHASGSLASGRLRYSTGVEYDYERIPVPDVTDRHGPDLIEESGVVFTRFDVGISARQSVTIESVSYFARTTRSGLSPRRESAATVDLSSRDVFGGLTHRLVTKASGVFTTQVGVFARRADLVPNGSGTAMLSPDGWSGNWFANVHRTSARFSAASTWERVFYSNRRPHDVTVNAEVMGRQLDGRVHESDVHVVDAQGRRVRTVEFGGPRAFGVRDRSVGAALRDVWQATKRLQFDMGVRADASRYGGGTPSGRIGARIALDGAQRTILKTGFGRFVGALPLAIAVFDAYPTRIDRWLDPDEGTIVREREYRPSVGRLFLPRAKTFVAAIERQLTPGVDGQMAFTSRASRRLATLRVANDGGDASIESDGMGTYRELQFSVRRTWTNDQQLFVSYVRAASSGEINDFASLFQAMDAPLFQPGGRARAASDAPHRILAWGTFNLPRSIVVSPVGEWRSGFPYSPLNVRHIYDGSPNSRSFPPFMAIDAVVYKTFTVKKRKTDLGVQLFNLTSHRNPRDVYPVTSSPHYSEFANSVGTILRGYMLLKW